MPPLPRALQWLLSHSDKSPNSHTLLLLFEQLRHAWSGPSPWKAPSQTSTWLSALLFEVFAQYLPFQIRPILSTPFEIANCHSFSALLISSPAGFSPLIFVTFLTQHNLLSIMFIACCLSPPSRIWLHDGRGSFFSWSTFCWTQGN